MFPRFSRVRRPPWGGIVDDCPDSCPIIGTTAVVGLYLNCGWATGGFKPTPGSGFVFAPRSRRPSSISLMRPFFARAFQRPGHLSDSTAPGRGGSLTNAESIMRPSHIGGGARGGRPAPSFPILQLFGLASCVGSEASHYARGSVRARTANSLTRKHTIAPPGPIGVGQRWRIGRLPVHADQSAAGLPASSGCTRPAAVSGFNVERDTVRLSDFPACTGVEMPASRSELSN